MDIKTERYVDRRTDRCRYMDRQTGTRHGVGVWTYGQPKVHGQIEVHGQTDRQGYTAIRPATGAWAQYRRAQTDRWTQTQRPALGTRHALWAFRQGSQAKLAWPPPESLKRLQKRLFLGEISQPAEGHGSLLGFFPTPGPQTPQEHFGDGLGSGGEPPRQGCRRGVGHPGGILCHRGHGPAAITYGRDQSR